VVGLDAVDASSGQGVKPEGLVLAVDGDAGVAERHGCRSTHGVLLF